MVKTVISDTRGLVQSAGAGANINSQLGMPLGAVTQLTNRSTTVELDAMAGHITLKDVDTPADTEVEFTFTNSHLKSTSLVLVSMNEVHTVPTACLVVSTHTHATGTCQVRLFNAGAAGSGAHADKVNFLIVNPS